MITSPSSKINRSLFNKISENKMSRLWFSPHSLVQEFHISFVRIRKHRSCQPPSLHDPGTSTANYLGGRPNAMTMLAQPPLCIQSRLMDKLWKIISSTNSTTAQTSHPVTSLPGEPASDSLMMVSTRRMR